MRVLQLIDSLETGGAEKMAISIANSLSKHISFSGLCATRKEGPLKTNIEKSVNYLFLNKKRSIDIAALNRLTNYIKRNNIEIIHAHSSSFFIATLAKFFNPNIKIVWHDHYGNSEFLDKRKSKVLKWCSKYFNLVICVNNELKKWITENLKATEVHYLQNFAKINDIKGKTKLKGKGGKQILHIGNLRPQKDHLNLLRAFEFVHKEYSDWTLHCIGKDFKDEYSEKLRIFLSNSSIKEYVFFYGSNEDIGHIIEQASICVLSSKSEGLPVSLLEYGLFNKPVVVTNVGACAEVVTNNVDGYLVEKEDHISFYKSIIKLINDSKKAKEMGASLGLRVKEHYSENSYTKTLLNLYREV